jgi:hypothetical protein|tara:strand:+ start:37 stop:234 length:198 start_codon:yes stop_codon:yes gene_type:complete
MKNLDLRKVENLTNSLIASFYNQEVTKLSADEIKSLARIILNSKEISRTFKTEKDFTDFIVNANK